MTEDLFKYTSGPRNARVVIVGEAWGKSEHAAKQPFVGYSGQELNRMLAEAGLSRDACLCTNVISEHPPNDDFTHFLYSNKEAKNARDYFGVYPRPALDQGIRNLWALLDLVRPELVIATGNWPLHILTPHAKPKTTRGFKLPTGITSWRGSQTYSRERGASTSSWDRILPEHGNKLRVLPLIHPAAITREWSLRSITVHDLRGRAGRFLSGTTSWEAPPTNTTWKPTLVEVDRFLNLCLARASVGELWLSVDIETFQKRFISCIGLADESSELCIPFFFFEEGGRLVPYWSLEDELWIWARLRALLTHSNTKIIGQNFIYDSLFLKAYCSCDAIVSFDTMVAHHLLYPGTPKGLHYLASLYCNHYSYWKDESQEWNTSEVAAEDLWRYNCKDTRSAYECAMVLRDLLARRPGYDEHFAWRLREWKLARKMALKGINFDTKLRLEYQNDLFHQANELQDWLLHCVPEALRHTNGGTPWYNSPTALMDMLYNVCGVAPVLHKKTKRPTSDDAALEDIISRKNSLWLAPVIKRIQSLRSIGVYRSHFLDVALRSFDQRFTNQWNIAHPETFRWSSSENPLGEGTNAQNIPRVQVD